MTRALGAVALVCLAACSRDVVPSANVDASGAPHAVAVAVASAEARGPDEARDPGAAGVRVVVAPADADALSLVRTKRLEAKAGGRVLVVYAGAAWCPPCKRFREELHAGKLDGELAKVTLLVFDADADADRLAAAGYGSQFIPYVALAGPDGRPADAAEARGKGPEAWRALLGKLEMWQRGTP